MENCISNWPVDVGISAFRTEADQASAIFSCLYSDTLSGVWIWTKVSHICTT